ARAAPTRRGRDPASGSTEPYWVAQESAESRAAAARRRAGRRDRAAARDEPPDRNLPFHAGERQAGAGMDAGAEREMPVRPARRLEPVGIGKLRRIAVGGADADVHVGASWHRDPAERGVAGGAAVAELVRAFHAEEFLHRARDQAGRGAQLALRVGMADQQI